MQSQSLSIQSARWQCLRSTSSDRRQGLGPDEDVPEGPNSQSYQMRTWSENWVLGDPRDCDGSPHCIVETRFHHVQP